MGLIREWREGGGYKCACGYGPATGPNVAMCMCSFLIAGVVIIGFFDNVALYCGSRDFINTTEKGNETPFCTFSGNLIKAQFG